MDMDRRRDAVARLAVAKNRHAQGIDITRSVRSLFEARVASRRPAIALETDAEAITYDQLNRTANRVARRILACRGTQGDRAVIFLDSNATAIAAMLAALKAGRTYVPLDPEFPTERLAFMFDDCRPRVILTDGRYADRARALAGDHAAVIDLDERAGPTDDSDLGIDTAPDMPAYILYTSGSTGRPKGVMQTQRNLLHFVKSYASSLGIQADDRLTLLYSFSFSAALMDIYGGLLTGATVLPHSVKEHGIAGLSDWLVDRRISVYHSVPTVFRHLLQTIARGQRFEAIRVIDLGGEPVTAGDIEAFKRHFTPGAVVVNHLAATEASVIAQYFIDHDTHIDGPRVPAGVSAAGVNIAILDDDLGPVPQGESGEILVGSEFLSPGYWQNADLTVKEFVLDPANGTSRLYRTGDLGRINADGLLEHLGRKDFRVKIRGLTIEVAEIEAVLAKSPYVRDVRVVARDFGGGDERLVAFVVGTEGVTPGHAALRELVHQSLPAYMAPATFVTLDALPLTATGKVDHKALTSMPLQLAEAGGDTFSGDSVEARLVRIWREVLRVPAVDVDDNFFELGGHSLMAMKMLARVEEEFGQHLVPNVMAQSPTVRGLADVIGGAKASAATTMIVPFTATGTRPPIFCIAPDHALHFTTLAKALGAEQPLFGVQPPHADGFHVPGVSVEYMAGIYADEIVRACPAGTLHLVGFCGGGVIAYEVAHVLLSRGRDVGVLALFDTPRQYNDLRGHRIGAARYYVRRAVHHPRVAMGLPLAQGLSYLADRFLHIVSSVTSTPGSHPDGPDLSPETIRALAANRAAFARYQPQPYPREIDLFLAGDTFSIFRDDPRLGWRDLAAGGIRLHWVPGGHNSFLREPRVGILKFHLEAAMARSGRRVAAPTQRQ